MYPVLLPRLTTLRVAVTLCTLTLCTPTLCATALAQGGGAVEPTPRPAGSWPGDSTQPTPGPAAGTWVVPAAFANQMGNWNNQFPFGYKDMRYQQVFLGSELTTQGTWRALALRQTSTTFGRPGGRQRLTIRLGQTTLDHNSLTANFAANANSGPLVTVADQVWYNIPSLTGTNANPALFAVSFPFTKPYVYTPQTNANLLVEIENTSTLGHVYSWLDAVQTGNTTSRAYAFSANATTGVVYNSGLVMCFASQAQSHADYALFGAGCPGTGGSPGVILPAAMRTAMGNDANIYGHSFGDQRYQQVFLGSEVGPGQLFTGHAFRRDEYAQTTGGPITVEVLVGTTTYDATTLTGSFTANATGTQTTVLPQTSVNTPALAPNRNPRAFAITIPWKTPWAWAPQANTNLLFESRNYDGTTLATNYYDAHGGSTTGRIWASPVTSVAAAGSSTDYGLVIKLLTGAVVHSEPLLDNIGRPVLGGTLGIALDDARPNSAALLVLGLSNKTWGPLPLPLNLAALGAPLCDLLVSFDFVVAVAATDANGSALANYAIPNNMSLDGVRWFDQWLVVDPTANGLGLTFSNGGEARIGQQ